MVDIYGSYFEYGGRLSREFGLIIANMETERNLALSGEVNGITVFNRRNKKNYLVNMDFKESAASYEVEFFTDDQRPLSREAMRAIEKWLFQRRHYQKLYVEKESDCRDETVEIIDGREKRLYYNCWFSHPARIESDGGVIGYKATLEADSAYLWQDPIIRRYESAEPDNLYRVFVDSDIDDFTYPKITIRLSSDSSEMLLVNQTDDPLRETKIIQPASSEDIVIDSEINMISGSFDRDFVEQNFPRLLDGENVIEITGASISSVEFEYQNRRML